MSVALEQTTIEAANLDSTTSRAINALMLEAWPHLAQQKEGTVDFLLHRWPRHGGAHEQRPLYHVVYRADELVALAHTFARNVASAEQQLTVMGLANVCVARSERGFGYGWLAVQAAFARVDRGDFPVSLFQTSTEVAPFYERLGAVALQNRFFNSLGDDPAANPFWEPVAMRYPATAYWPAADIDLRGPGF